MLVYKKIDDHEVVSYLDSNYVGCLNDKNSTLGSIFILASGAISWKSVKQTLTKSSTMQAKFVTCYKVGTHVMWLISFISMLKVVNSISRPLKVYYDDYAAMMFSKNNKISSGFKHIEIKYVVARDMVKNGDILVEHLNTEVMIANPLS